RHAGAAAPRQARCPTAVGCALRRLSSAMEAIALRLYSLLMWLTQPLLRRKLRRRARAEAGYGRAVAERFGHYTRAFDSLMPHSSTSGQGSFVWIHAVSLG